MKENNKSKFDPCSHIGEIHGIYKIIDVSDEKDKYGNKVRVVTIGDSLELCGGTHVKNTKEIKKVAVFGIENKGSNVYRIWGSTDKKIANK